MGHHEGRHVLAAGPAPWAATVIDHLGGTQHLIIADLQAEELRTAVEGTAVLDPPLDRLHAVEREPRDETPPEHQLPTCAQRLLVKEALPGNEDLVGHARYDSWEAMVTRTTC